MAVESVSQILERHGIVASADAVHVDLAPAELVEAALAHAEGTLAANGALVVETGKYTGRSPKDRFVVDTPEIHDTIAWGNVNVPISQESYEQVRDGVTAHLSERGCYVVRGLAGANRDHARKFMVTCELASQALFITQLLVRPTDEERASYGEPDFTILAAPGYKCDSSIEGLNSEAAVLVNFTERTVVIAGTEYSGEIKKSVFSVMNYLLPVEDHVLPMHCSASMDPETHDTAVFFGLSGTGKTTLSADPKRLLIGDDEHGWAMDEGIFNIEGGCYAKCDGLTEEREPEIFRAVKFGALCENVILNDKREPDYDDTSLTENTRVGYPIEHIPNAWVNGSGGEPTVVIFLTCDAFGVLPPIARLSADAAMYHFVSGFTSKVAGTEVGIKEPVPTFSSLFGEPFMPLDPMVYADMLGERIAAGKTRVYLVNTGWVEGSYGVGHRIPLIYNRINVNAALDGSLEQAEFIHDDVFNLDIPTTCAGVPDNVMVPWKCWESKDDYDATARKLAHMFQENFEKKYAHLPENVKNAGPHA
ncbi:phosphoenolpyruvate carboxykinase (ATP) [Collinsella provencensis]|uniref:phosphoenolpyruvate carboxykinase (ATP) n=1 Tax=Collinsella provencensis TaxID=1937461 RepID=UPI000C81DA67|nr:phosphoenolpyruvate carboxykinase (ATP) [Collinsella provencensis]